MNKELQIFSHPTFGDTRIVDNNGEPWWVLRDVCDALGLSSPTRVAERLDRDEVSSTQVIDALGRNQETFIINESGLYNVIFQSRKPEAKEFKRWVTHEVLPTIRKHGAYMTPDILDQIMKRPDLAYILAKRLSDEMTARIALEAQVVENAPKVNFANAVTTSTDCILMRELAKYMRQNGVLVGEHRLYTWMRNQGFIMQHSTAPTQRAMEQGLFEVQERAISSTGGTIRICHTTKVTPKGQLYFLNRLCATPPAAVKSAVNQ